MKFKVSKETMKNLRENISAFNNGKNSVRFAIGLQNAGKGLACQACVVRDGQQVVVGFLTAGVPNDFEKGFSFAVKAGVFCDYMSKLLAFDADFTLDVTEKGVKVSLPGTATVTLPLVPEANCEPLIVSDEKDAYVAIEKMKSTDFMTLLKKGGYLAKAGEDARKLTDHVAFAFLNGRMVTMSADGYRVAKAEKPATIKYNELMSALLFFEKDARPAYVGKVTSGQMSNEEFFKEAAEKGYKPNVAGVSLPVEAVSTLLKLSGVGEEVSIMISENNMYIVTGNLKLCFKLGAANWANYARFISNFENMKWSKVVVDKDSLLNAFSIASLACSNGTDKRPVIIDFAENGMVLKDSSGNKVKVGYVEKMDGILGKTIRLNCVFSIEMLSRFASGNIVIGCADGVEMAPVLFADGTMSGENNVSNSYILQVTGSSDEKKEEPKKNAKKAKKSDVEDADTEEDIAKMAQDEEEAEEVVEESEIEEDDTDGDDSEEEDL